MPLNDTRIRTLKIGDKAERLLADGNGLYLRLRKSREEISRTWQFRRTDGGKLSITKLGEYPALSLKDARLRAAELAARRDTSKTTVKEAAEQWLAERVNTRLRNADQVEGYVNRAVIPKLGSRRVRDVTPSEIGRVIRDYRDHVAKLARGRKGGRPAARALLAVFKGLFGYAVANGWIEQSPAAQLTAAIVGQPDAPRARVLTDDEIRFAMTTRIPQGRVLRFLLMTGLRLGEAYSGFRDGQYWVVSASASKNGREHRVWLSPLALAQLEVSLAQLEVSPWGSRKEAVQLWLKVNAGGWTAHDLRRTFSTRLNGMGTAPYVVEKMLNHTFDGVMAIYNRTDYDAERRQALVKWSDWLATFIDAQSENVVPIGARRQAV